MVLDTKLKSSMLLLSFLSSSCFSLSLRFLLFPLRSSNTNSHSGENWQVWRRSWQPQKQDTRGIKQTSNSLSHSYPSPSSRLPCHFRDLPLIFSASFANINPLGRRTKRDFSVSSKSNCEERRKRKKHGRGGKSKNKSLRRRSKRRRKRRSNRISSALHLAMHSSTKWISSRNSVPPDPLPKRKTPLPLSRVSFLSLFSPLFFFFFFF